jgi:sulfotransferase family protein
MSNPYVFIVGCPRSGTTLLQRVVNAHPKIAVMPEAHWIYQLLKYTTERTPERTLKNEILPALMEHPKFARLGISREQLLALMGEEQHPAYSTFVQRIFDLYGKMQDKELVGNKTPGLVRRLELVQELWPQARIVHLIRDGRDVFLSIRNRPLHNQSPGARITSTEDPVSTAALWWELNVQMGRAAGQSLGPKLYREVRYESLVSRPAEVCAELCGFLEMPSSDAMLKFYETGKTRKASRPITPGLRDWGSQMSPEEVEVFESAAGRTLAELGYARAFPHPRGELVDRSARSRGLLLAQTPRYARALEGLGMYL